MSQTWTEESLTGNILYGSDSLYGNGYYGSIEWTDKTQSSQTYTDQTNTNVTWTEE